jgi:hypothetical protein
VKKDPRKLVTGLQAAFPQTQIRVAFVGYIDYDDPDVGIIPFTRDFTTSSSEFVTSLNKVVASGGGDAPEDVFTGLAQAATLGWRSSGEPFLQETRNRQRLKSQRQRGFLKSACSFALVHVGGIQV